MERINKLWVVLGLVISFGLFFTIAANADESDKATSITFSAPVQIPGKVLSAGTYRFKLADTDADLHVVEIFNSAGTKLYATLQAIPTDRQQPSSNTVITLAEQSGAPDALLRWFYPGCLTGNEFVYPGNTEKQLEHSEQKTLVVGPEANNPEVQVGE